jgi:hypothetical protein
MNWKVAAGVTLGLFGAGVTVGCLAQKKGIPRDQIGRWVLKGATRRILRLTDAVRDVLPNDPPRRLAESLAEPPPRPGAA